MESSSKSAREARQQKLEQVRAQRDAEKKERQAKEAAERKAKKLKSEGKFVHFFVRSFVHLFNLCIFHPFEHIKARLQDAEDSSTALVVAKTRVSFTFCLHYTIHYLNLTN